MTGAAYLEHGGESGNEQWLHSLETLLPILGGPPSEVPSTEAHLSPTSKSHMKYYILSLVLVTFKSYAMASFSSQTHG